MKKNFILLSIVMMMLLPATVTKAYETEPAIVIDGEYEDWEDKPAVYDRIGETNGNTDFKELRFYREGKWLYLYLERIDPTRPVQWDLRIPIINANKRYGTTPVFLPWDEIKDEDGNPTGVWPNNDNPTQEVAYQATISYRDGWDSSLGQMVYITEISVIQGGCYRENFRFRYTDPARVEFAIPLNWVGLGDEMDEVSFAVGANTNASTHAQLDWVGEEGPINITQGPIFGSLTPVVALLCLIGVGLIASQMKNS